ncbi:hypothetical protein ACFQ3S_02810 [Mucilaginibacter terrae]|uniref:hypothetical protein n=1 Tax=Mucilaginibacter terrae TaxID=1955052 RepID=UPI00363FA034
MFVSSSAIKNGEFTGIPLYRLAKNNDKTFPYIVFAGIHIETDSLLRTNRRYIGKYLGHEICHIEYKNVSGLDNLYIIQIDSEVVKRDNNFKNDVSNGFLYVNHNYYIAPYDVSNKVN